MAKITHFVGVPLPVLPPGLQWRSLGRWIDLRNAGTLPQIDQAAFLASDFNPKDFLMSTTRFEGVLWQIAKEARLAVKLTEGEWSYCVTVWGPEVLDEDFIERRRPDSLTYLCRRSHEKELASVDLNPLGERKLEARELLRRELGSFIIGVGDIYTKETESGFAILKWHPRISERYDTAP